ncbi:MAG: MIP/aquaporin family protein [Streptosporangiaceae bacterium]|jgi:aquaporin Z
MGRKFAAEFLGTILLVFFGAGAATLVLGYRIFGSSLAAGIVLVALTFGLIYAALVYVIGPISGGHVNPAVTLGAYISRRIGIVDAVGYWVAQLAGGIVGALLLYWMMRTSPFYTKSRIGLGANGYGASSLLHVSAGGAFLVEVILSTFFVLVVLSLTREEASVAVSGMGIGIALALANLIGIPFDGASVNPARSFGPAVVAGGAAFSQVWVFLLAPLVGAVIAAGLHFLVHPLPTGLIGKRKQPEEVAAAAAVSEQAQVPRQAGATMAGPESSAAGAEADPAELTRPAPAAPENPDRSQRR